jgi:hypothetical protein
MSADPGVLGLRWGQALRGGWHPYRDPRVFQICIRWCRSARPPATRWDASGIPLRVALPFNSRPRTIPEGFEPIADG